jgi:RNA polymerase sigma factor (sigma-70 family)
MNHPVLQILALGNPAEFPRADMSDGELLERFLHARDDDAFATVVRRHGPMVLAVCRRVLRNHADADDAFQATFLVLIRKAASLGTRRPLGPWLHGVAFNCARRLQRANLRRSAYERAVEELPDGIASESVSLSSELMTLLDEELARLPERYRVPIILCDLEGLTRREAATQLGCPEGTVAGRLARARALLATRIAGRGVVPSAGILSLLLTQRIVCGVPPDRVASVVKAASGGQVSARVTCLVEKVVAAMFLQKFKSFAAILLLCGLIAATGTALRSEASAGLEPTPPPFAKAASTTPAAEKALTVIPLRKLDPAEATTIVSETFTGKRIIVAAISDERSLLLYADAVTTQEIRALLTKLEESAGGKSASRIRLHKETDCRDVTRALNELFNGPKPGASTRVTIIAAPDENALLVYATPIDMLTIRTLVKTMDEGPAPQSRLEQPPGKQPKKYTFGFRNTPWAEVLDWYAKESGLTPILTVKPTGTVTIMPPKDRQFTLDEITDLINESLMAQKFILIRRQASFLIHPADEKIDPTLIPRIELGELKERGKTELVQAVIPVPADAVQDLVPEIRKLLSPFGSANSVKGALVVMDTAGNVTRIAELLALLRKE